MDASLEASAAKLGEPRLGRCFSPLSQASTEMDNCFSRTVSQDTHYGSEAMLPESAAALWGSLEDGPALTSDGRALDLDGGVAIFFSCAEELSQSHEAKVQAKEQKRSLRAMHVAHTLCEAALRVDSGEACSVTPDGTVYGATALEPPVSGRAGGARPKLALRKRRMAAARHGPLAGLEGGVLCPDSEGKVSIYVYLDREAAHRERRHQRMALKAKREAKEPEEDVKVLVVDTTGIIRGCRGLCEAPPVIPAC